MVIIMRNWSVNLAVAAVLSAAATADGGSPGVNGGGFNNATLTSEAPTLTPVAPTVTSAPPTATFGTTETTSAAPKPHSVEVMLNKAENDPNLKYCTMDGLFCIPRNYSK